MRNFNTMMLIFGGKTRKETTKQNLNNLTKIENYSVTKTPIGPTLILKTTYDICQQFFLFLNIFCKVKFTTSFMQIIGNF